MAEHFTAARPVAGSIPGRSTPVPDGRLQFFFLDLGSNPSKHKLFDPPSPVKDVIQFQGDEGLKIKKSIW